MQPLPFVGRATELSTLRALVPRAEGEGRRVVLLGGEAGSGKSRLVREVAARAATEDVLVLYGACDAVVRSPYGPFVEALDHLARTVDPDELRAALGPTGGRAGARAPWPPTSCAPRSARPAASWRGCCPTCRRASEGCPPPSPPTPTPSATG